MISYSLFFLIISFIVYLFIYSRLKIIKNLDKYIVLANEKICMVFRNKHGILRENLIKNISKNPWNIIYDRKIYPKPVDKINYLMRELINQHIFIDGNKRLALIIVELMSDIYCLKLKLSDEQKYQLIINLAKGSNNILSVTDFVFRFRIINRSIDQIISDNKNVLTKLGIFGNNSGLPLL